MAVNAYFSHIGTGNRTLQERAESFGFDTFPLGENIAAGYNSVRAVVLAWMWYVSLCLTHPVLCLSAHKRNLLEKCAQILHAILLAALKGTEQTLWGVDLIQWEQESSRMTLHPTSSTIHRTLDAPWTHTIVHVLTQL